jgi:hypothetical protein
MIIIGLSLNAGGAGAWTALLAFDVGEDRRSPADNVALHRCANRPSIL